LSVDNAGGLRGLSKALIRPLDDHVINALRDIADQCSANQRRRPPINVTLPPLHTYDHRLIHSYTPGGAIM